MEEKDFYIVTETGLIDPHTGEIISPEDYIKENFNSAKEMLIDANKVAKSFGVNFDVKIVKKKGKTYLYSNVKESFDFKKVFHISVQSIFKNKMDIYSKAFIGQFTSFIAFPENYIEIDGATPTIEELAKLMNVKRNKIYEILVELEYFDVIKKIKNGRGILIYFNPYLYSTGWVDLETVKMFAGSIYNIKNQDQKQG